MNANGPSSTEAASRPAIIEKELSREIVAAFYDVYNALGFGFLESIYAKALEIALPRRGLFVQREAACEIYFMGERVGVHRADMIVEHRIVVEVKAAQALADINKRQLLNYVSAFGLRLGILLHFGPKPSFHRVLGTRRYDDTRE
jgi:GxxExxY protein